MTDGWSPSAIQQERIAYRRRRTQRSVTVSAVSAAATIVIIALLVRSTPGWPRVKETFFDVSYGWSVLPDVLKGLWLNVQTMVIAEVVILILGLLLASVRTLRGPVFFPLRAAATAYVDIFRGLPLLIVILLCGFGVPALGLSGVPLSVRFWGTVALILTYTAYVAEVLRAGMESVHPSQWAAARSLGLGHFQTLRHVIAPQGIRRVIPALLNDLVSLQKDSGLISILGVADAIQEAQIHVAQTFNETPLIVAALLFVILTIPMTRFTDWVAKRQGAGVMVGGPV